MPVMYARVVIQESGMYSRSSSALYTAASKASRRRSIQLSDVVASCNRGVGCSHQ